MDKKLTTAEIVILASAGVMFLFSFFNWFGEDELGVSGWDGDWFPLWTYVPIIGIIAGGQIALTRLAGAKLPDRILGFDWLQIHVILGLFAVLLMIGLLLVFEEQQFGFVMCLLGSIGLLVGALMQRNEAASPPRI